MKPKEPLCIVCRRPVDESPENFKELGAGVSGYVCYGCSRLDPARIVKYLGSR